MSKFDLVHTGIINERTLALGGMPMVGFCNMARPIFATISN